MPTLTSPDMKAERTLVSASATTARAAEATLVEDYRQGCPRATESLFAQLSGPVEATIRRLLGWPTDGNDEIEDVLQNVFLAAWQHRRKFRGNSSIRTWITRIAINECRRVRRRRYLRRKWWHSAKSSATDTTTDEEAPITRRETAQRVREAIQQLKTEHREVIVLYYLEQMKAREIAEALRIKQGTVEVRLTRARQRLAKLLGGLP